MRQIKCKLRDGLSAPAKLAWSDLALPTPWTDVVAALQPARGPRPVQLAALRDCRLLESRRNLLVSAPTNAGKTLVGLLPLLEALRAGQPAVFLTPLKAVAHEQAEYLQAVAPRLEQALETTLRVRVTTGDCRLDKQAIAAPRQAEIVVATPERFEAILRNPRNLPWIESLAAVSVDEAQLIASPRRGPTLEYLITALLCLAAPPRLTLLCEPLASPKDLLAWLAPCDWARVSRRWPPLSLEVWAADAEEDTNACVSGFARQTLSAGDARLLVFVYRTQAAEKLAKQLNQTLTATAGPAGAMAYHAHLSPARRREVREAFEAGSCRLVVTTTALAMGVNLPATHVLVRDTLFHGAGRLEPSQILQMAGRAGRGDTPGAAVVLVRPRDGWNPDELAGRLSSWRPGELSSHFDEAAVGSLAAPRRGADGLEALAAPTLSLLSRRPAPGATVEELRRFFARSLGGAAWAARLEDVLRWLAHPDRRLVYRGEQGRFQLTRLGACAARLGAGSVGGRFGPVVARPDGR